MSIRSFDWGGFYQIDPLDENPPLSPSEFGKQLMAAVDANAVLTLLGTLPVQDAIYFQPNIRLRVIPPRTLVLEIKDSSDTWIEEFRYSEV